jgi:hypothetical protein
MLTSTGCAGKAGLLAKIGAEQGRTAAGVTLPALPDDCRVKEPHAALSVGAEARLAIKAERRATDRANARVGRCAGFYDATKAGIEAKS